MDFTVSFKFDRGAGVIDERTGKWSIANWFQVFVQVVHGVLNQIAWAI